MDIASTRLNGTYLSMSWKDQTTTFFRGLEDYRKKKILTDITLACDGACFPAHKLVLCSHSEYFCELFANTTSNSLFVFVRDTKPSVLICLLEYIYLGEINLEWRQLSSFLKLAKCLRMTGLIALNNLPLIKSRMKRYPNSDNQCVFPVAESDESDEDFSRNSQNSFCKDDNNQRLVYVDSFDSIKRKKRRSNYCELYPKLKKQKIVNLHEDSDDSSGYCSDFQSQISDKSPRYASSDEENDLPVKFNFFGQDLVGEKEIFDNSEQIEYLSDNETYTSDKDTSLESDDNDESNDQSLHIVTDTDSSLVESDEEEDNYSTGMDYKGIENSFDQSPQYSKKFSVSYVEHSTL